MPRKLPTGWARTTLGEVCALNPGLPFVDPLSDETEVSFVPMSAVEEETGEIDTSITRKLGSVRKGYTPFIENDVIFAKITPCMENGKVALATGLRNGIAFGSTELFVFRAYEGLLPRFLLHFLLQSSLREKAELSMTGASGQKRVPAKYLVTHDLWLPPFQEQVRIVEKLDAALSSLRRAESASRRATDRLQHHQLSVLKAAFTGELTVAWRQALSKVSQGNIQTIEARMQQFGKERRKRWEALEQERLSSTKNAPKGEKWKLRYVEPPRPDSNTLPPIPDTWVWVTLDEIANIGSGISVSQSRKVNNPIELPYLRVANVLRGYLDLREVKKIRIEKSRVSDYLLRRGDILFTEGGDRDKLGRGWIWEGQIPRCVHQNHVFRARLIDPTLISSKLVSFWGNSFGQQFFITHGKQTTNLASINRSVLGKLPIPVAPLEEQVEILREVEQRLAAAERLRATIGQQQVRSTIIRNRLLDEAFSGTLVQQEATHESASVLLDRMRFDRKRRELEQALRREAARVASKKKRVVMKEERRWQESLLTAWEKIGHKTEARRLFDEAGFTSENVVQFYEELRATPELRTAFDKAAQDKRGKQKLIVHEMEIHEETTGRFRLVSLWLEDFKNLKDYSVDFNPAQGLDVVLGWNGTGKSNLFEALVIIFRDLHEWWEKNRWPDDPLKAFKLSYEMDGHVVEINWRPSLMKRPELKRGLIASDAAVELVPIKREQLPMPRFVFGYYSGPTNRMAEHFLPMKQDHYDRLRLAKADDAKTLAKLLEQRRFFCAETHHAKYVLLGFSYKEDPKISEFLEDRLRIVGFESALFIIRKPQWAKSGSRAEDFWSATGIMRRVMERLRRYAIAPMVLQQKVNYGYRSATEDHYYFFLPDLQSLHSFAGEYQDARTFFLALESTDFSELIHDVKIQVRVKSANTQQVSITFHQLSEGEQQLLMVLGLMRFTKSHQSLVLLDEPDTHLNPHWSVDYIKDLARVMSDNALESAEQQTSQILMATHDPLVIASLVKEQIHLLKRDPQTGACKWEPASVNPRGLGFTGILTSEMFGFRSDLDPETLNDLDRRARLIATENSLNAEEKKSLEEIDQRLAEAGFSKAFSDPYYAAFVRAWGRRHSELMAGQQFVTPEKRKEIDRIATEVLKEAVAEVEKSVEN